MFRLIAVSLAALYFVLLVFGDESRRPEEVARSEGLGLRLVTAAVLPTNFSSNDIFYSEISDRQAVEMAIAAGEAYRAQQKTKDNTMLVGHTLASTALQAEGLEQQTAEISYWYVTGSRVNLRLGPGTSNPVVGQVTFGMEAEVLNDRDGWFEIKLADGTGSGWIFGKFLNDKKPG